MLPFGDGVSALDQEDVGKGAVGVEAHVVVRPVPAIRLVGEQIGDEIARVVAAIEALRQMDGRLLGVVRVEIATRWRSSLKCVMKG